MGISKITRNFQVTLPRDVRQIKGLTVGDQVLFAVEGQRVEVVKLDKDVFDAAFGLWADTKETGSEYTRKVRKDWRRAVRA